MKYGKYQIIMFLIIMIFSVSHVFSQTFANFELFSSYTDNLFQNYAPASDYINSGSLSVYHQTKSKITLYYNGILNLFSAYPELQNHSHYFGVNKKQLLGNGKNELYFGSYIRGRIDDPVYEIFDYVNMYGFTSVKYYLQPTVLFRAKNATGVRSYIHYSDYSYIENIFSLNISKFLQTRTTLQAGLDFFIKDYLNNQTYTVTQNNSLVTRNYVIDSPMVSQLAILLKIAQNIDNLTAIQLRHLYRKTLSGQNRFAEMDEFYTDDVLFDDHYSYSGRELFASVKRYLPFQLIITLSGYYLEKMFNDRAVYDIDGNELADEGNRRDYQTGFTAQIEKKFSGNKVPVFKSLTLFSNISYIGNVSNDPYYQFSTGFLSAGIEANL